MSSPSDTLTLVWHAGNTASPITLNHLACDVGVVRLFARPTDASAFVRKLALPPYYHFNDLIHTDDSTRDAKRWVKIGGKWRLRKEEIFCETQLEAMLDSEDDEPQHLTVESVVVAVIRNKEAAGGAAAAAAAAATTVPTTITGATMDKSTKRKIDEFRATGRGAEALWVASVVHCCREYDRHDIDFCVADDKTIVDAWMQKMLHEQISDEVDDMVSVEDDENVASRAALEIIIHSTDSKSEDKLKTIRDHKYGGNTWKRSFSYAMKEVTVHVEKEEEEEEEEEEEDEEEDDEEEEEESRAKRIKV